MNPPKILIVDDDYPFAQFAKMLLESSDYRTAVCMDGHKASEMSAAEKPDLILMDINMPGVNGIEVIRDLKNNPATRQIPIILCSITTKGTEVKEALSSGAIDFIPKPLKSPVLIERINRALESKPQ